METNLFDFFLIKHNIKENDERILAFFKNGKDNNVLAEKILKDYLKNRDKIIESYFKNFKKDLRNKDINIWKYSTIFFLEDSFCEGQPEYFSDYFLELIKDLKQSFINNYYNENIFYFVWNLFDRIFHECFHCAEKNENEYKKELNLLKEIIITIDPKDNYLIKQKIEQFI